MIKTVFGTKLTAVDTTPKEEVGVKRIEWDPKFGERIFRYVRNKSGGALNAKDVVSWETELGTAVAASAGSTTSVSRAAGSFVTDGVRVNDFMTVIDDAGAAGAAPEGERSFVTDVEALTLTFSPALTAAIVASDTVNFHRPFHIVASAANDGRGTVAGVPMANIADGSYGWIQTQGIYDGVVCVAAGTAIAKGAPLYPGTKLLTTVGPALTEGAPNVLTVDTNYASIATAMLSVASDTVLREVVARLMCE